MQADGSLAWRTIRGEGFNALIGPVRFARAGPSEWHAALALDARHINAGGVAHGGVVMALADIAMGAATYEAGEDHPCATIQMDCHFLAASKAGAELVAVAQQLRRVRELSFMACELHSGGRQVARASGVWKHLASRGAGQSGP